jgi:DNA (cytosine-5)-methyltransferase 1
LEFFAGVGLARLGLERAGFEVVWSNDRDPVKQAMYAAHFRDGPGHPYLVDDVGQVRPHQLPGGADLAWASSPCTDLSLAGTRSGLAGPQSSAFWLWVELLAGLGSEAPAVLVLENVTGLASSHGGADLRAAIQGLNRLGHSVDLLVLDARRFLPQSRPRLFLVGAKDPPASDNAASELRPRWTEPFHDDPSLRTHRAPLPAPPPLRDSGLDDLVEDLSADDPRWWGPERRAAFLGSLSPGQARRLDQLSLAETVTHRTAYRRTRQGQARWEVRADPVAGCLRTARGGSSKQAVVRLGRGQVQSRWLTPLECARLMGADDFELAGARVNQAWFAFGDAVAVPVVEWLARECLLPLTNGRHRLAPAADRPVAAALSDPGPVPQL